jgi:hypothetical protein
LSTIAFGVPAGTTMPVKVLNSWPLMPASAMVGTFGSAAPRALSNGPPTRLTDRIDAAERIVRAQMACSAFKRDCQCEKTTTCCDLARALWIVSYAIRFGVNNQKQNFQSVSIPDFFIQSEPLE